MICRAPELPKDQTPLLISRNPEAWQYIILCPLPSEGGSGQGPANTMTSLANLELMDSNKERVMEANELDTQVLEAGERVLGADHLETLISKDRKANTSFVGTITQMLPNEHDEQAPTDSGYASGTHGKPAVTQSYVGKDLEKIIEGTDCTNEDSAIAGSQLPDVYAAATMHSASETSSLPPPRDKGYIADLAVELFNSIQPCESRRGTLERISELLPDLLRAFALKLGYKAQTLMHRDISFFVHKHRRYSY